MIFCGDDITIDEKSSVLDVFKLYRNKVENQLRKKIKIVRSDHGG